MRKTPFLLFSAAAVLATPLASCVPVIAGGAATAAYVGLQDRPATTTAEDTKIKVAIKERLTSMHFAYLTDVGIDVFYGDVLLTGIVPDQASGESVIEVVRTTQGVKRVYNELFVGAAYSVKQKAQDAWIGTQLQSRLLGSKQAYPLNYLLSVVNSHVYIIGTVSGAPEHDHVLHILRTTKGVAQVHDYLTVRNPEDASQAGAPASARGTVSIGNRTFEKEAPDPLKDVNLH